jgi:hypothetical protein
MRHIDLQLIEKLHKDARRQRAHQVHCLLRRAILRIRARVPGADAALLRAPCCTSA